MKKTIIELGVLLTLSLVLFFFKSTTIPENLAYDEVAIANLVISLDGKPYTPFSPLADGHATLYPYILLFCMKFFGISTFAFRLPAKIFGVCAVLVFYLIMRRIFNKNVQGISVAFLATFIFFTLRWYFNFVRFSFEMPFLLFLELASILLVFKYLETRKILHLVGSGILAGLAFNSYQPGRIFFLLPLLLLFLKKAHLKSLAIFFISFLILITPLSYYLLTHAQDDIRIERQLFLKNDDLTTGKKIEFLAENVKGVSLMYFVKGDDNGRHNYPGKPALNPLIAILFAIGLVLSLKNLSNIYNVFFLMYFAVAAVPSIITYPWENPNMLRLYATIPSVVYFVTQSLIFLISTLKKTVISSYIVPLVIILVLISSFYDMRTYFKYQKETFIGAFAIPNDLSELKPLLYSGKTDSELYRIYNKPEKNQ